MHRSEDRPRRKQSMEKHGELQKKGDDRGRGSRKRERKRKTLKKKKKR